MGYGAGYMYVCLMDTGDKPLIYPLFIKPFMQYLLLFDEHLSKILGTTTIFHARSVCIMRMAGVPGPGGRGVYLCMNTG